jgi:phospholipid/cholesterol/gamma-HCH transport system ATP-binding protein
VIDYKNINITLGGRRILNDISLHIGAGEIFCIAGRSGVGKSVMIKQLVGLLWPDSGSIKFMDREVTGMNDAELLQLRKECGMVFQHATLFDSMSCVDNVALPVLKHHRVSAALAREKALKYMADVGIEHLADRDPSAIGPGLRKLVAVARTLTMKPKAILYDEPTTGLDPPAARKFDRLVKGPLAEQGMTQVLVSHDVRSIFDVASKVALLHDGHLRFLGTPGELEISDDYVVRSFIKGENIEGVA